MSGERLGEQRASGEQAGEWVRECAKGEGGRVGG